MNLADHLRPLLRDHDCVIIPDFGGLVVEYTPAQVRPAGRHLIFPPTRQVAFNQALTRNDGLLVDTLRQHLGLGAPEAREAVRQAVATLHQQLQTGQRTELPGIGVFRQLPGRGLQFDYTGTDNLLPAAFGLPELSAHPVRTLDARLAREQQTQLGPRLRSAGGRVRWRRLVPGAAIGLLAGVAVAAVYLLGLHPEATPVALRGYLPRFDAASATRPAPQQAALAQPSFALPALTPLAVVPAPAATVVAPVAAPVQTVPATAQPNPAETLLLNSGRPAAKTTGKVVPSEAAVALGNESNVARPVPMAKRQPGSKAMSTTYPVAPSSAKWLPTAGAMPITMPAAAPPKPTPVKAAAAPATAAKASAPAKALPMAPARVPAPAATAVASTATTINRRTGRYYVVVAAYSSLARAEEGRRVLAKTGHSAKVILPYFGTRHYRLSVADFPDQAAANLAAAKLRQNPHFDRGLSVLPY